MSSQLLVTCDYCGKEILPADPRYTVEIKTLTPGSAIGSQKYDICDLHIKSIVQATTSAISPSGVSIK